MGFFGSQTKSIWEAAPVRERKPKALFKKGQIVFHVQTGDKLRVVKYRGNFVVTTHITPREMAGILGDYLESDLRPATTKKPAKASVAKKVRTPSIKTMKQAQKKLELERCKRTLKGCRKKKRG